MSTKPKKVYKRRRVIEDDEDGVRAADPVIREKLVEGIGAGTYYHPPPPPTELDLMTAIEKSSLEAEQNEINAAMELIAAMEAIEAREREQKEKMEREKGTRVAVCDLITIKLVRLKTMGDEAASSAFCTLEPIMNEYKLWGSTRSFCDIEKEIVRNIIKTVRFTAEEKATLAFIAGL